MLRGDAMALSEESIRFLEENHAQNSREWFLANRERYLLYVEKPMLELAGALAPVINAIDPLLNVRPERVLTRIRRDTRFSRDKSLYKRSLWLVFQRARGMVGPLWFFEFNADMHRFGCGYYSAPARDMARIRELVVSDDKRYRIAQEALDAQSLFSLEGECFRRPHYADFPERRRDWPERRNIVLMHSSRDRKLLFAPDLASHLSDAFRAVAPVYAFLAYAHDTLDMAELPYAGLSV